MGRFCRKVIIGVGPEREVDDFKKEENGGEEGEGKGEEVVRIGDEPVFGRGGNGFGEVFEVLMIEMDVFGVVGDESASFADVGKSGENWRGWGGLSGGWGGVFGGCGVIFGRHG